MLKTILTTSLIACFALAESAYAGQAIQSEKCGKLADSFAFVVDASGSMMETVGEAKEKAAEQFAEAAIQDKIVSRERSMPPADEKIDALRRIELAKAFIARTSKIVMEKTEMASGLYSVAPFAELVPISVRSGDEYQKAVNERLTTNLEVFGRPSWLGERGFAWFSQKTAGTKAVVLVTDGEFDLRTKGKRSPIDALTAFGKANPGSCVHIVSAAYTPEEKAAVKALSEINACTVSVELEDVMRSDEVFEQFIENVFFKDCSKIPAIEIPDVYFDFDKASLKPEGRVKLQNVLKVIEGRDPSEKITIEGWTDWMGSDAYNAELSQKRAEAVMAFFIEHGIDPARLTAEGKGKSFKYENQTKEGRSMNRRVELLFTH